MPPKYPPAKIKGDNKGKRSRPPLDRQAGDVPRNVVQLGGHRRREAALKVGVDSERVLFLLEVCLGGRSVAAVGIHKWCAPG